MNSYRKDTLYETTIQPEHKHQLKEVVNRVRVIGDTRHPELLFDNTPEVANALQKIGVHAVVNEGALVVRRWHDIGILYDHGLVQLESLKRPGAHLDGSNLVKNGVIHLLFPDTEYAGVSLEYKFPITFSDKHFPQHTPAKKVEKAAVSHRKPATKDELEKEPLLAYEEWDDIVRSWQLGCEPDEPARDYTNLPSLKLFRNNPYKWEKGKLYKSEYSPSKEAEKCEVTKSELQEIHIAAKGGDREALDAFAKIHIGLVLSTVARLQDLYGGEVDDMVQAGYIGLMKALQKYDVNRSFSTYAVIWMNQSIQRQYMDTHRLVRIPVHRSKERGQYYQKLEQLRQSLQREPNRIELARAFGMSDVELDSFERQNAIKREFVGLAHDDQLTSGHMSYESDELISECDNQPVEHDYDTLKLTTTLNDALSEIKPRDAMIVRFRTGFGVRSRIAAYSCLPGDMYLNLEFVGSVYGVTREHIRQLEARGLRFLRNPFLSEALREFL